MSSAYSSQNPGPTTDGFWPLRCALVSLTVSGAVVKTNQSELGSSHAARSSVGQPMSTWKPAMAEPKTNPGGKCAPEGATSEASAPADPPSSVGAPPAPSELASAGP